MCVPALVDPCPHRYLRLTAVRPWGTRLGRNTRTRLTARQVFEVERPDHRLLPPSLCRPSVNNPTFQTSSKNVELC